MFCLFVYALDTGELVQVQFLADPELDYLADHNPNPAAWGTLAELDMSHPARFQPSHYRVLDSGGGPALTEKSAVHLLANKAVLEADGIDECIIVAEDLQEPVTLKIEGQADETLTPADPTFIFTSDDTREMRVYVSDLAHYSNVIEVTFL
jgi:hypothetical protein